MALHADTIWEVRTTGNNNNGGGWHDLGGASVDYSEQDAPELSVADAVANGTTTVTSATGGFTAAMAGSVINILTKGRFEIAVVTDGNTITVDRNVVAGSGLTLNVGGGVADPEEIDSIIVNGNTVWIKAGTYNAGGNINFTPNATAAAPKVIRGYNASRDDNPRDDNRPLFNVVGFFFGVAQYCQVYNLRVEGSGTRVLYTGGSGVLRNCYAKNTSATATNRALEPNSNSVMFDCEAEAANCLAVGGTINELKVDFCKFHDSLAAIPAPIGSLTIIDTIFDTLSDYAIDLAAVPWIVVKHCTFYNVTNEAIKMTTAHSFEISNCQFRTCGTGIKATGSTKQYLVDGNNYSNNTADVSGIDEGPNATADVPGFANEAGGNFSEVDDSNAIPMQLGVS